MNDLRSGKEFWNEAREELGYTSERGYEEKSLLHEPYQYKELFHTGRETEYGDYTIEVKHDCRCDELSRQIAFETGQASGRFERGYRSPGFHGPEDPGHVAQFEKDQEREIMRQEFGPNGPVENTGENTMNDTYLQAGYDAKQQRIDRLEAWIAEAISKPSMPRDLRMQGLEFVQDHRPDVRQSVERICPSRSQGLERSLEIER